MSELSFRKDASFDKCPKCKSVGKLRRSRAQSAWEQIVKKIGIFNYFRCRECGWRGSRLTFGFNKTSLKTILIYFSLMLATALIVRFVLQKIALK
jgi:hypothetical protein